MEYFVLWTLFTGQPRVIRSSPCYSSFSGTVWSDGKFGKSRSTWYDELYIWVVARIEDTFRMDMGRTGDIQAFGVEETLKKKGEGQKKKAKQSKAKKSPKRGSSPSSIRGIN